MSPPQFMAEFYRNSHLGMVIEKPLVATQAVMEAAPVKTLIAFLVMNFTFFVLLCTSPISTLSQIGLLAMGAGFLISKGFPQMGENREGLALSSEQSQALAEAVTECLNSIIQFLTTLFFWDSPSTCAFTMLALFLVTQLAGWVSITFICVLKFELFFIVPAFLAVAERKRHADETPGEKILFTIYEGLSQMLSLLGTASAASSAAKAKATELWEKIPRARHVLKAD